jgi:hypothetical protein
MHLAHSETLLPDLLQTAVKFHNKITRPSGYSPYFFIYGTIPPDRMSPEAYAKESTWGKKETHKRKLAQHHEALIARERINGLKASRNQVRAYLQEKKALLRVYASDNWVLRVRQRYHKLEPFYDNSWVIASCYNNNIYIFRSPGGVLLANKYNKTNLFPTYVQNGYPIRSLWYASKQALERDRARLSSAIRDHSK